MDIIHSTSGFSLVIPAYFISAGIVFYTGILLAIIGLAGKRVPLYIAFALTCFGAAGFQIASAFYYLADTVTAAGVALRWQVGFIFLVFPALFYFIALYTGQRSFKRQCALVTLVFSILIIMNYFSPYSIRFTALVAAPPLILPWGETLAGFKGTYGPWNWLVRDIIWVFLLWALWRAGVQFRRGERRSAIFLAICLLLIIAASIWGALIDLGIIHSVYIAVFAFLALVLLMSVSMGIEIRDRAGDLSEEIDRRKAAEKQIRRMAYEDYLTGLANRAQLHEHLAEKLAFAKRTSMYGAMLLIDLDHFKTINDALSHDVGDDVLREVGRRMRHITAGLAFVARLGGDEFVAVLSRLSSTSQEAATAATILAQDIVKELSSPLTIGDRILNVGASIGIAEFPNNGSSSLDALRHADMALYRAKHLGRGNVQIYEPQMQIAADERHRIEKGLRAALENDEFDLYYQPQVNAAGKIIGAEALLRWRHPELGVLSPQGFIQVAEETGLIHAIGAWVLDHACQRLKQWTSENMPFSGTLSINISPWQFSRPDLVSQIGRLLARHDVDPGRLMLEITESALLYDLEETIEKLNALRGLGISISLDDFGTGYSSLSYLKSLPLDELKIDKSFIKDLASENDHTLVVSVIAIGHHMHLNIIAEGVETESQRDILKDIGCERFQGYYFCYPLPEKDFMQWLMDHDLS